MCAFAVTKLLFVSEFFRVEASAHNMGLINPSCNGIREGPGLAARLSFLGLDCPGSPRVSFLFVLFFLNFQFYLLKFIYYIQVSFSRAFPHEPHVPSEPALVLSPSIQNPWPNVTSCPPNVSARMVGVPAEAVLVRVDVRDEERERLW